MYQVLAAGGWVMPFIVVCSVLALAICIERHFALNKQRIAPPHLLATVWQQLRGEGLDAQRLKALRQGSPLGAILAAGLANRHQGRDLFFKQTPQQLGPQLQAPYEIQNLTIGKVGGNVFQVVHPNTFSAKEATSNITN